MRDTAVSPIQRIKWQTKTDNIESDTSSSPVNSDNPNQHNPGVGASQSDSIGLLSSRLSRFPTASLPQCSLGITITVHIRAWHSSQGTPVVVNELGWVHRVALKARDPLQNRSVYDRTLCAHQIEVLTCHRTSPFHTTAFSLLGSFRTWSLEVVGEEGLRCILSL